MARGRVGHRHVQHALVEQLGHELDELQGVGLLLHRVTSLVRRFEVEARIEVDSHALRQFAPCDHVLREPTLQEQEELGALSRRSDELGQQARALDDAPEWSADEAEVIDLEEQDIAARRKAIQDDLKTWAPEAMAHAGAIVTVNREGDAEVIRGLVREWDRKALVSAQKMVGRATS
jgi:ParB family transcriptional regulator, chromosome partitioning protein